MNKLNPHAESSAITSGAEIIGCSLNALPSLLSQIPGGHTANLLAGKMQQRSGHTPT